VRVLSQPLNLAFSHEYQYPDGDDCAPEFDIDFKGIDEIGRLTGSIRTRVLLDSGSNTSMLDYGWASPLGIDVSGLPDTGIDGIVPGRRQPGWLRWVVASFCGQEIELPVVFAHGNSGILGRQGIFDNFNLAFLERQFRVVATPFTSAEDLPTSAITPPLL